MYRMVMAVSGGMVVKGRKSERVCGEFATVSVSVLMDTNAWYNCTYYVGILPGVCLCLEMR